MNFRMIGQVVGRVLCIEAALMLLPMIAAVIYDESPVPFLITIGITGGIGLVMWRVRAKSGGITARDGFLIVGLSWIAMSLLGAIPFVLTGDIPNYVDALFETISGLTTTGASVVTSPESMTRGGMFWRLFTHWIGGMGILVFVLAVLPMSGNRSMHIMRAEVPGPTVGKLVPRIRKTASILYLLYIALTLVETVLLISGGMSFYDALLHSFATAGTGGLSTRALSIGYYNSAYIDIVVGVFMILFGANFSLYYLILLGNIRTALRGKRPPRRQAGRRADRLQRPDVFHVLHHHPAHRRADRVARRAGLHDEFHRRTLVPVQRRAGALPCRTDRKLCHLLAAEQDRAHDLHAARPSGDLPAAAAVRAVHVALEISAARSRKRTLHRTAPQVL